MVCTPRSPMTVFLKTEIPYNPYLSRFWNWSSEPLPWFPLYTSRLWLWTNFLPGGTRLWDSQASKLFPSPHSPFCHPSCIVVCRVLGMCSGSWDLTQQSHSTLRSMQLWEQGSAAQTQGKSESGKSYLTLIELTLLLR